MSSQFIHVNGHRFHYDDSMYYLISNSDGMRHFREGDMIAQVLGGDRVQFAPVLNCEIGDHIPREATVIRRFASQAPAQASPSSAQALLWIMAGFGIWAVVSLAIDWAMGG